MAEKPLSPVPQLTQTIHVTAEVLKQFAHNIEQAQKLAVPGEKVLIPFTRKIMFVVEPDIKTHQLFGSHFTERPGPSPIAQALAEGRERGGWEVRPAGEPIPGLLRVENLTGTGSTEVTPVQEN